jgi:hypothetical protein
MQRPVAFDRDDGVRAFQERAAGAEEAAPTARSG